MSRNCPAPESSWSKPETASIARSSICKGAPTCRTTDDPFRKADALLAELRPEVKVRFVDFHAELTSEKVAMGWYLDGRVSAMVGTHTHIPTADTRILPGGTAYQTDVGMTGPYNGVIGVDKDIMLQKFLTQMPVRMEAARHGAELHSVIVDSRRIDRPGVDQSSVIQLSAYDVRMKLANASCAKCRSAPEAQIEEVHRPRRSRASASRRHEADRDYPPFPRSARDGFAVRASDVPGELLVTSEVRAGENFDGEITVGQTVEIMTGAPIPRGADAVVMVEHSEPRPSGAVSVKIPRSINQGENFVPQGSEAKRGETILRAGCKLGFAEIGVLAMVGREAYQSLSAPPRRHSYDRRRNRRSQRKTSALIRSATRTPGH